MIVTPKWSENHSIVSHSPGVNGFGVIVTPKWSEDHSIVFAVPWLSATEYFYYLHLESLYTEIIFAHNPVVLIPVATLSWATLDDLSRAS